MDSGSDAKTVYIVDDDPGVRASLQMLMLSIGIRAQAYDSGEAFLDEYNGERACCLLLDVRMPGMSGFEVKQRLVEMDAPLPVIFLTAQGAEEVPARLGPTERVQKPFRDEYLVRRIRQLAGESGE